MLFMLVSFAFAADLEWDHPGTEQLDNIKGYTIYFTDGVEAYNKTVTKEQLVIAAATIEYQDIDHKLNLQFETPYAIYITAFNDSMESEKSNTVEYTRVGYQPPLDRLPEGVLLEPSGPSNLKF